MSTLAEGLYALEQVQLATPLLHRFATNEGIGNPVLVKPHVQTNLTDDVLWKLKKSDDNWHILTSSSPTIPAGGGPGPVVFGFSNNDVSDGNFTTVVGSPTEYVLKPQGDDKFVIELASPPEGASDLAYYLGVDGDDKLTIKIGNTTTLWLLQEVVTED